jgi:hypothetical protein
MALFEGAQSWTLVPDVKWPLHRGWALALRTQARMVQVSLVLAFILRRSPGWLSRCGGCDSGTFNQVQFDQL